MTNQEKFIQTFGIDVWQQMIVFSGIADQFREFWTSVCSEPSRKGHWINVNERLPHDRDWYLGIFKESDTGWVNPIPYVCDYVGCATKATTKEFWILRGFTDIDIPYEYYKNLECVAWMPLPEPCGVDMRGAE